MAEETCGCVTLGNALSDVSFSAAAPDRVCGVPTNPCSEINGMDCSCVQLAGPASVALSSLFAAGAALPTHVCGIPMPNDPCANGSTHCQCVSQVERQVHPGGGATSPVLMGFQRIVTPPALCVEATPGRSPVCGEYVPDPEPLPVSEILYWLENAPEQLRHCLAADYCGVGPFPETITDPPQRGQTVCCPSQYATKDYYKVIDATTGANFGEWVLQLAYYAPGDSVDHRIGWNNQIAQTKKSSTHFLRDGSNPYTWLPATLTHVSDTGFTGACGEIHYTYCNSPCSLGVASHFAGLDIVSDYSRTTEHSHTVSWNVQASRETSWDVSLDNAGLGASQTVTIGYGESNTWTWSDEIRQSWHSTEQIYRQTYTA